MLNSEPRKYDLEERTARFGEESIDFCKKISRTTITTPSISQLVRSTTSVGSNYCEANCAESRKDFEHKLGICNKESSESKHWLRMIARAAPVSKGDATVLWKEANELQMIFIAIIRKSKENSNKRSH
jgi:four helix bundle protein